MPEPLVDACRAMLCAEPSTVVAWTSAGTRTRADLRARADEVARLLPDAARGGRVALCVRDGFSFLAAFLAIAEHGAAALLFDAADPRAPRPDLAQRLGASAIVVDRPGLRVLDCGGGLSADGLRAVKLTSGSTGEPRAIAVSDEQLLADADQLERTMGIGAGDRVFAAVPMSFSYGVGNLLVPALVRGRVLVLPDAGAPGLLRALRAGEPTVLPAVPALLRALLQGAFRPPDTLRLVLSAGAVLPPEVAAEFRTRFGRPVHVFYGSTESGGISYDRRGDAAERGSVGEPVDGVEVAIRGDGRVSVCSAAVGEALDGSDNPSRGRFVTPDFGALVGGELQLRGRAGAVFDVGGHKVDPGEIEGIVQRIAGVRECAALPWRDEHGRSACAVVVAGEVEAVSVRTHCARLLPAAKVPRCCVVVAALPRTSRGKLARDRLRELLPSRAGDAAAGGPQQ